MTDLTQLLKENGIETATSCSSAQLSVANAVDRYLDVEAALYAKELRICLQAIPELGKLRADAHYRFGMEQLAGPKRNPYLATHPRIHSRSIGDALRSALVPKDVSVTKTKMKFSAFDPNRFGTLAGCGTTSLYFRDEEKLRDYVKARSQFSLENGFFHVVYSIDQPLHP